MHQRVAVTLLGFVSLAGMNAGEEVPASVLQRDDECQAAGDCAMNALQLRMSIDSQRNGTEVSQSSEHETNGSQSAEHETKSSQTTETKISQSSVHETKIPQSAEHQKNVSQSSEHETKVPQSTEHHHNISQNAEQAAPQSLEKEAVPVVKSTKVLSWAQLKKVVEASKTGERIHIPKGITLTFKGTININEGTHFDIWSEGATLDGRNAYGRVRMFYVRGSLKLTGFILKNGKTDYAGAAYFDFGSMGNITNCSFRNNEASYMGGAIVTKGAHLMLTNVDFRDNSAQNTCLSALHCSRRRRNGRRANAMYVLSHTKFDASLHKQPRSQDIFFDKDFDGHAVFHCARPRMEATDHRVARRHVHMSSECKISHR
jgi:hypothetical protein